MDPKLVKLEREIGAVADQMKKTDERPRIPRKRSSRHIKVGPLRSRMRGIAATIPALIHKFIRPANYGMSLPQKANRRLTTERTSRPTKPGGNAVIFDRVLIWVSFGLVAVLGVLVLIALVQIRDLKAYVDHLEHELAATGARLTKIEKAGQQVIAPPPGETKARARHAPLALSDSDVKVIRQFIRVLPQKPGGQQTIHLGDEISNSALASVPDSLVDQLPALRGSRFLIDKDGSIVIVGAGSDRADAIISYN